MKLKAVLTAILISMSGLPNSVEAADYVQIATHSSGGAGALWESDLEVRADGGVPAEVRVDLLGMNRDNSTPLATHTLIVPAGASVRLVDLIEDTFSLTFTTGALRMTTISGTPSYQSRTANRSAFSTFSFDIPAEGDPAAVSFGSTGRLIHLTANASFTTSLGFVNTTGSTIAVSADLYRADGTYLRTESLSLVPFDMQRRFNVFPTADVDDGYAVLSTSTSGGAFLASAIVVDLFSGDWVWLPAEHASGVLTEADGIPAQVAYLPVVGRTLDGAIPVEWTDLELKAGPNGAASVQIELLASNQANPSPATATLNVPIGQALRVSDVLGTQFATTGSGALRLTVTSGWLEDADSVTSVVAAGSTWARFVAAVPASDAFGPGRSAMVLGLSQDADREADVGLVNLSGSSSAMVVTLLDPAGRAIATFNPTLAPWEHRELGAVLTGFPNVVTASALVVATQPFLAYGSVVELTTGDVGYSAAVDTPLVFLDGFETGGVGSW